MFLYHCVNASNVYISLSVRKNACSDNDRARILVEKNERDVVFGRRSIYRYSFYDLVRTVQHVEVES